MEEVPGSEKFFPAQLVFLALGFLGPQAELLKALGVKQDARSNVQTPHKVRVADPRGEEPRLIRVLRNTRRTWTEFSLPEIVAVASR